VCRSLKKKCNLQLGDNEYGSNKKNENTTQQQQERENYCAYIVKNVNIEDEQSVWHGV
jgi:hypothetical protein